MGRGGALRAAGGADIQGIWGADMGALRPKEGICSRRMSGDPPHLPVGEELLQQLVLEAYLLGAYGPPHACTVNTNKLNNRLFWRQGLMDHRTVIARQGLLRKNQLDLPADHRMPARKAEGVLRNRGYPPDHRKPHGEHKTEGLLRNK